MARAISKLLRGVYRELFLTAQPLPNPPEYKQLPTLTPSKFLHVLRGSYRDYLKTWTGNFDDEQSQLAKQHQEDVEEQRRALKEIKAESKAIANASETSMNSFVVDAVEAYRLSVKAFVEGYKDASRASSNPSILKAFGDDDHQASSPQSSETKTEKTSD
eukprot:TRINITY_DN7089_c0_g1_i2.p1 TRINITY_DN7089_c0_g1~~TRINITY_DN7089_c0_g1_i2.p1  ORF type:complete len:167 (+),score=37.06 TRINITY_DN7089_c0_g1_i2:23-502(+)